MTTADLVQQPGGGVADHNLLGGLTADDHPQYLLLAGRAGGQAAFGGTAISEELILRGTTNANLGLVRLRSPIVFDDVTPANALQPYSIRDGSTAALTAGFIGGTFSDQRVISTTNVTFIYEVLRGAPLVTKEANDGFAAFTLFQALPILDSGTGAGHNPLNCLVLNAGPSTRHLNTGTRTANNIAGMNFSPQLNTRFSNGQTLNAVNITGMILAPKFNTNAGTTISFGTIRGTWMQNPDVALFGSGAGVETMTALIGLDTDNITFGGNVTKAAVRSAQTVASNAYFLLQTGTAQSLFNGEVRIGANNIGLSLGAGQNVKLNWNGTALEFDPLVGADMRFTFAAQSTTITNPLFLTGTPNELFLSYDTVRTPRRFKIQGVINRPPITPTTLVADANNYQGMGTSIFQRGMVLVSASGAARTITGFDVAVLEDGDELLLVNVGATENVILGHQDTGSLAANRMVSPTGADLTLQPNETAKLWYDNNTSRWRILEHTGASTLLRSVHLSGDQFRKGATAPTDVTIGTTPTVNALRFAATNELASVYLALPEDMDRTKDITLRLHWSLVSAETNTDTLDLSSDYTAVLQNSTGSGVAKTSTGVTGQVTVTTGNGLAVGDVYVMDIAISAADATNPLASAVGIAIEIHLTNTTGVASADLLDANFLYEALI